VRAPELCWRQLRDRARDRHGKIAPELAGTALLAVTPRNSDISEGETLTGDWLGLLRRLVAGGVALLRLNAA